MIPAMLWMERGVGNMILGTVSEALVRSKGLGVWIRLW